MFKEFRDYYKNSAWLPFVLTLTLFILPGIITQVFLSMVRSGGSASPKNDAVLSFFIALPLLLGLISNVFMLFTGISQIRRGLKLKGWLNISFSTVIVLLFIVPLMFLFVRPVGMWATH